MTEGEMVGWDHGLDGHEFEQTVGVGDGQGIMACCGPWGCEDLDTTEQLSSTDTPCCWVSAGSNFFLRGHLAISGFLFDNHSWGEGTGSGGVCYCWVSVAKPLKTALYINGIVHSSMCAQSLQSCLTVCDPMDCSPPGSCVHGVLQRTRRIPEQVATPSSRGSSPSRDQTCLS